MAEHPKPRLPREQSPVRRFFRQPFAYDCLIAFAAAGGGSANMVRAYNQNETVVMWLWLITTVGVLLFTMFRAWVQWTTHRKVETPRDLEGCLQTMLWAILSQHSSEDSPKLRITLHQPVENGTKLEQVVGYAGDQRGSGRAGRQFPVQCGIIGAAYRLREPFFAYRTNQDYEAFVRELVADWSFTEADARNIDPASMSWAAVPLMEGDQVLAILFADAILPNFFEDKKDVIFFASAGVAEYAARRYK